MHNEDGSPHAPAGPLCIFLNASTSYVDRIILVFSCFGGQYGGQLQVACSPLQYARFVILSANRFIGIEVITANELTASKYPLLFGGLMGRLHGRHSVHPAEGDDELLSKRQAAVERQ